MLREDGLSSIMSIGMVGEITVDSFLDLLGQSDLVSDAQLLALTAEFLGEDNRPESPQKLAEELVKRSVLTTWQADMLLQGKHRGFRLGPYRILRPLGQGGMSKVFLAEHEMMHRRSAIKVLPSKYQEDTDLLNRFHLEARAVAALDHPNIVRAYDFNKDVRYGKEIHYLVMEYVEGSDLRRMVEEQGPLDCRKAADFIGQAAEGLAHAHAAGFVHRDIKPANLLVDPHGVLKILDLGLATLAFEAEQTLNPTEGAQSAVGTADYVSPEQVLDSRNVDGRADIYSLGLTLYFLLTGRRPFPKSTIMEVLMAHRTERPEPIGKFRPDVPMDLEAIVDKMTAKSPAQRHQTAKDVAEKMRKWLSESGSGRTYSRISALMAEAARTKQPSEHETSPAGTGTTATSELGLAMVDDQPPPAGGNQPAGGQEAAAAKAKKHPTVGKGSVLPRAKKLPERPAEETFAPEKPAPADNAAEPTPPSVPTDLLSGLLAEDAMSGLPAADLLSGLPAGQGPLEPVAAPQSKKQGDLGRLLKSPWAWVGLAGVALLALLLVLVILWSSSPTEPTGSAGPAIETPASAPSGPVSPPPTAARAPQIPSSKPAAKAAPAPTAKQRHPSPKTPRVAAKKTPAAPKPVVKPAPPPAPAKPAKQPEPAAPPPEEPVDTDALLAGLKQISVRLTNTLAPNPKNYLSSVIATQAKGAARRLDIELVEKAPDVMEIDMSLATEKDLLSVVLSARLKCPAPNGKTVTAWEKSEKVLSGNPKKMNPAMVLRVLNANVGKIADKFFEQFAADVKRARERARAK